MTTKESSPIGNPVYPIMFAIGGVHLLNDSLQSVIPAMFPILEKDMGLTFTQLGLIAFALNMVASVLQPVVGYLSDRKPKTLCTTSWNDVFISWDCGACICS